MKLWIHITHKSIIHQNSSFFETVKRNDHVCRFLCSASELENSEPFQGDLGAFPHVPVLLTDEAAAAEFGRKKGFVVFGLGKAECFSQVDCVWETFEAMTFSYMEMHVFHHIGLPYTVGTREGIRLRESISAEFEELCSIFEESDMPMCGFPVAQEITREFFEQYIRHQYLFFDYGFWSIIDENDMLIGWCGFSSMQQYPELGYIVKKRFRRRHIAYRACMIALHFLGDILDVETVALRTDTQNQASVRLAEKLGFIKSSTASDGDILYMKQL